MYADALALQEQLLSGTTDDYLLLLEHPHVFTLGIRGDLGNIVADPAAIGAAPSIVSLSLGGALVLVGVGVAFRFAPRMPAVDEPPQEGS